MNAPRLPLIALGIAASFSTARADLTNGLLAYYNFEESGTAGILNRAAGGLTHPGSYGNGTTFGMTPAVPGSGAGFAGSAAYPGAESTASSDRSTLLVGKALNVAKGDADATAGSGWFNVPTLNAALLGSNFAISAWFYLVPDEDNTGTAADVLRDYVFESGNAGNFDVSFGTNDTNGSTFVSWIGSTSGAQNAGTLSTGQWHHVVHVFSQSGANTALTVYIDGKQVGSTVFTATTNLDFTSLNFGAARTGIRVFDGMLDEVAVWGRSLTANEVIELHERGKASLALDADLAAVGKGFVSVDPSDPTMGQTYGTGLYDLDEIAVVEAVSAPGHLFTGWSAPFAGKPMLFNHIVTGSVKIPANFVPDNADSDGDGLTNREELAIYLTLPDEADTDGDLINDGDEVKLTKTDPKVSQRGLVDYVRNAFPGGAGAGDTVIARNTATNTLTLKIRPRTSTDLGTWATIVPAATGVSAGAVNGSFRLQVPASGAFRRFFQLATGAP